MDEKKRHSILERVKKNWIHAPQKPAPTTYKDVLKDMAEGSSLHGIGKVVSSRQLAVKVLWLLLLLATIGVFLMQLTELFKTFYSNPVQTSVRLSFSPQRFPAITFCNMNSVRQSMLNLSENLELILADESDSTATARKKRDTGRDKLQTETNIDASPAIKVEPLLEPNTQPLDFKTWDELLERYNDEMGEKLGIWPSKAGFTDSTPGSGHYDAVAIDDDWKLRVRRGAASSSAAAPPPPPSSSSSGYPSYSSYYDPYYSGDYMYSGSYSGEDYSHYQNEQLFSKKDKWETKKAKFKVQFRNETREKRIKLGHQREQFIHQASFAGVIQNKSSETLFKTFTTTDYGNCYTMESSKYVAWRSGPSHGIRVTLNIEVDEYIKNFASGYGVRLVFHTPGTYPLPTDEGLTMSPGTETNIGLRMVQVERLGPPYGECTNGEDFNSVYDYDYSSTACFQFCRTRAIVDTCGCIPSNDPDKDVNTTETRICEHVSHDNGTDQKCILRVDFRLNSETSKECVCLSPCRQHVFEQTLSARSWPKTDYLQDYLMSEVCEDDETSLKTACNTLKDADFNPDAYKDNFLSFLIYFEDLNYESIVEEPLYSGVRFLSDIGGAMGLFMGASVLTYVELLQLLLETLLFCRQKLKHRNENRVQELK